MADWQTLLEIPWPKNACDRSGECCRGAAQVSPWKTLLRNAAQGNSDARDFLNQYMPYPSRAEALKNAPDAVVASLAIALERGDRDEGVIFYHCRFLKGKSECQIYEDRPQLCRDFPESPFGAVPSCCGYYSVTRQCRDKLQDLQSELADLKQQQALLE